MDFTDAGTPGKAVPTNPSNDSRFTESHSQGWFPPLPPTPATTHTSLSHTQSQDWFPLPYVLLFTDQYGVTGHRPLCRETDRTLITVTTWEAKETPEKNVTTSGVVTACTDTIAPSLLSTAVVTESVQYPHTIAPSLLYTDVVMECVQCLHTVSTAVVTESVQYPHTIAPSLLYTAVVMECVQCLHTVSTAVVTESVQYPHSQFLQLLSRSQYSIHTVSTAVVTESVPAGQWCL